MEPRKSTFPSVKRRYVSDYPTPPPVWNQGDECEPAEAEASRGGRSPTKGNARGEVPASISVCGRSRTSSQARQKPAESNYASRTRRVWNQGKSWNLFIRFPNGAALPPPRWARPFIFIRRLGLRRPRYPSLAALARDAGAPCGGGVLLYIYYIYNIATAARSAAVAIVNN